MRAVLRSSVVPAVLLLAAGATSCGRASPPDAGDAGRASATGGSVAERASPADVVRLWEGPLAVERFGEPSPPRRLLTEEASRQAPWQRVQLGDDGALVCVPFAPEDPDAPDAPDALLVPGRDVALALALETPHGACLSVRVELAADGPDGTALAGVMAERRTPWDLGDGFTPAGFQELVEADDGSSHRLVGTLRGGRARLEAEVPLGPPTGHVLLLVLAPRPDEGLDGGLRLLGAEVLAPSLPAWYAAGHELPQLAPLGDGPAVRALLDRERRSALPALPGRRYRLALPVDPRSRRLDLALGVHNLPGRDGAVRLRVLADGAPLLEERVVGAPPDAPAGWRDVSLPLPAGTRELELLSEGEGEDPPLALWGQPTLRAAPAPDAPARPNVVLISLDTLRPDHLGCYGAEPSPSPRLDALAAEGLLFRTAYSTSSYTLPSHASMLSGQHPSRHGLVDRPGRLQRGRSPALAEMLAEAGWVTAAFTGGGFVGSAFGLDRGFDRFSHNDPVWALDTVRGEQLLEVDGKPSPRQRALLRRYAAPSIHEWIARQDDGVPFFLFLHTYVVHNYAPDRERLLAHRLLDPYGEERRLVKDDWNRFNSGERFLRRQVHGQYVPYYDATIEMADEFVGGVLDALQAAGLDERTLVLVTSDHGEEFGEHGYFGHGQTLFDANTRVPLLVRLPRGATEGAAGLAQPAVHDGLISLVDLAPWILRLAGLSPDPRMAAEPPLGAEHAMPPERSTVYLDLDTRFHRVQGIRQGALKLHERREGEVFLAAMGLERLYDVAADPDEWNDLAGVRPEDAARLREKLAEFTRHAETLGARDAVDEGPDAPLDEEVLESLRQLGYLDHETGDR